MKVCELKPTSTDMTQSTVEGLKAVTTVKADGVSTEVVKLQWWNELPKLSSACK